MFKAKIFKKILSGTLLTALILISGFVTLILNPQCLFAYELEYDKYSIYSNYEIELSDIQDVLDQSQEILKSSELYDPSYRYEIFFSHNTVYNKLDNYFKLNNIG